MFVPYNYTVQTPRTGGQAPTAAAEEQAFEKRVSVLTPVSVELDLEKLALSPYGYFLMHSTSATIQRIQISASIAAQQGTGLRLQLVVKDGQLVTPITGERVYKTLPLETDLIEDAFPSFSGALFLLVTGAEQVARLFVTMDVLTSKVI